MKEKKDMNNAEKDSCLYFDMNTQERDATLRYLLGSIIKCRKEEGFPSNSFQQDEDVNVYLAHLLFAISLPEYHEMANPYLSQDSSEILEWVKSTEDRTIRYFIFKVNADHLLVHSTIFDDLSNSSNRLYTRSPRYFRELAKLYYDQAASYHRRIYRKRTGVGEVLEKISRCYEPYQTMLKRIRRDYFSFINSYRDIAFKGFVDEVNNYEVQITRQSKMDHFLDLYGQWMREPSLELKDQLIHLVNEMKKMDPQFKFDAIDRL